MNKAFTLALCELSLWLQAGMEISKFAQYHWYLSSVRLWLIMDYPNTLISWFTRQLDLDLMFTSIISLRMANWNKWTKLFTDFLALSIGSSYSLALFIWFGGFTYWIYLLALFIGFIYFIWWLYSCDLSIGFIHWLHLFIAFIYSIWWLYLFALSMGFSFSVYSIHHHGKLSQFFSHLRKEHLYISLNIHIPRSHGKNLLLSNYIITQA